MTQEQDIQVTTRGSALVLEFVDCAHTGTGHKQQEDHSDPRPGSESSPNPDTDTYSVTRGCQMPLHGDERRLLVMLKADS
ncbi:hypothetical protein INR49_010047 [Caranx melampygus]|nr:hypothetical protein INR49_010047 [Caranx melampygus]